MLDQVKEVESERERIKREWDELWQREHNEQREREREQKRAQTVGELVDVLGQNTTTPAHRREVEDTLCQILDRARAFFADNEVCRGALVIAAAAIGRGSIVATSMRTMASN